MSTVLRFDSFSSSDSSNYIFNVSLEIDSSVSSNVKFKVSLDLEPSDSLISNDMLIFAWDWFAFA